MPTPRRLPSPLLRRLTVPALLATAWAVPAPASAQATDGAPLSLESFAGWTEWPLYEPGDLQATLPVGTHRTWYAFTAPSGDTTTVQVDVRDDAWFQAAPAFWVQHIGNGGRTAGSALETTSLDAMVVDLETFRVLFRVGASAGGREWAGTYDVTHHFPDRVVRTTLRDDASISQNQATRESEAFDFVTMPYLLAVAGLLEEGRRFRLMNVGSARSPAPRPVGIHVVGRSAPGEVEGWDGEAWKVELLSNSEALVIDFLVAEKPPYFLGWRFRVVATGRTGAQLRYRGHVRLEAPAGEAGA